MKKLKRRERIRFLKETFWTLIGFTGVLFTMNENLDVFYFNIMGLVIVGTLTLVFSDL